MTRQDWQTPDPVEVDPALNHYLDAHPLVEETLTRRGITTLEEARGFLDPDHYTPAPASHLPGLPQAVDLLLDAVREKQTIGVWGDFDVDGQTSTALLVSAFRGLNLETHYYIPNREKESHGISLPSLKRFLRLGLDLLVTCDTGVSAHQAVDYARDQGLTVIITDHHDPPPALPRADSVVNPSLLSPDHPLFSLPGAGVAYKLIEELFRQLKHDPHPLLDLVALAIVADLAPQRNDTRFLLQRGLDVLRQNQRVSLDALYQEINLNPSEISAEEIGFQIGPRLNALGRLADANPAVEFLISSDPASARTFAARLEGLNQERRRLTEEIFQSALNKLARQPELVSQYAALVLSDASWHPGVIGIVASRLVERFHKPTLLFVEEDDSARGSARSVPGVSIIDHLENLSGLLSSFGGHPMAAGMELPLSQLPQLRRELSRDIHRSSPADKRPPLLKVDAVLPFSDLNLKLVDEISRLAPFGPGNPELVFCTQNVQLLKADTIGRDRSHRKLTVVDQGGTRQKVLWWQSADLPLPEGVFDLAYTLSTSTYGGSRQLQLTYLGSKSTPGKAGPTPEIAHEIAHPEVIDARAAAHPRQVLDQIKNQSPSYFLWSEGKPPLLPDGRGRTHFTPAKDLIVWTIPPSRRLLVLAQEAVAPDRIHLFAHFPPGRTLSSYLPTFMGLIKHHLHHQDPPLDLEACAQATGQTLGVTRLSLSWLKSRGDLKIISLEDRWAVVQEGSGKPSSHLAEARSRLQAAFTETLAYRINYLHSSQDNVL